MFTNELTFYNLNENIVALCIILVIDRFSKTSGAMESLYAGQLAIGDQLVQLKDGGSEDIVQAVEILLIKEVWDSGYWAPLTSSGTLLVDGFLASCYASFPHDFSQVGQLMNFLLLTSLTSSNVSLHPGGLHSSQDVSEIASGRRGLPK